jgi:predicted XRE-type DNA-binding protein
MSVDMSYKIESRDMSEELQVTRGSSNVFADLGFKDADQHLLKARLAMAIATLIKQQGLSQIAASDRVGISQPDISKLLRGRVLGFSLERLFDIACALGTDVEIKLKPASTNRDGHLLLRVA